MGCRQEVRRAPSMPSPSTAPEGGTVSRGKGVRREAGSGGSRRQPAGPTNRNRMESAGSIRGVVDDETDAQAPTAGRHCRIRQPRWMRGQKDSKSNTCTESAEVYAAGISGKVGVLTRGGLTVCRPERGDTEHRSAWPSRQKSAEGMVGRRDAAEGPNTERGWRLNLDDERRGIVWLRCANPPREGADGIGEGARAVRQKSRWGRRTATGASRGCSMR